MRWRGCIGGRSGINLDPINLSRRHLSHSFSICIILKSVVIHLKLIALVDEVYLLTAHKLIFIE